MSQRTIPRIARRSREDRARAALVPSPRATWKPDPELFKWLDRRVRRHHAAERRLAEIAWSPKILPSLRQLFKSFWDFAIDDAIGKAYVGHAKYLLRNKGHWLIRFQREDKNPQPYLDARRVVEQIVGPLREPGRPPKTPFHDLVASAYLLASIKAAGERMPRLELLRQFLEVPELGYRLGPGDVTRIGCKVLRKVSGAGWHEDYPSTSHTLFVLNASRIAVRVGRRPAPGGVRNGGFAH